MSRIHSEPALFQSIPNHPECRRNLIYVLGPPESKLRVIITPEKNGEYVYRYKRPGERQYVWLAPVAQVRHPKGLEEEYRICELVSSIY